MYFIPSNINSFLGPTTEASGPGVRPIHGGSNSIPAASINAAEVMRTELNNGILLKIKMSRESRYCQNAVTRSKN